MTLEQIFAGLLILILFTIRPFAYRPIAKKYSTKTSSICTGTWLIIGTLFTLPFCYKLLFTPAGNLFFQNPIIILSICKGVVLWFLVKNQQSINKKNVSASVFFAPIGLGLGAITNRFLFNEQLTQMQFFAVFGLGLLGLLFFMIGPAKTLSTKNKKIFCMLILFTAFFMSADHLVISRTNWYVHIVASSVAFFLTSFLSRPKLEEWKNGILNFKSARAGLIYVVGEFYLLSTMVTILPVSLALLFIRLAIPFVMVISVIVYKEGKWNEQLLFGCFALILCLPLIFK